MATNTSKLNQLKQRFIDSYTESGWNDRDLSSWDEFSNPDVIKFFQQIFTHGLCVNFQLAALEHLKGWKEYVIHFGESEYDYGEHSVLKHPDKDLYFDVFGFRRLDDVLATYDAQNAPHIWHSDDADVITDYSVDEGVMSDITLFFINMYKFNEPELDNSMIMV